MHTVFKGNISDQLITQYLSTMSTKSSLGDLIECTQRFIDQMIK